MIQFRVYGDAQPQGSMRAFMPKGARFPVMTSANSKLRSWRQLLADAASRALDDLDPGDRHVLLDGVRLIVAFYLPRPKSLRKSATAHTTKPDLDKLVRSCCDCLTAIVFRDDSQVCELVATKQYAGAGRPAYVDVRVEATHGTTHPADLRPQAQSLFQTMEP